MSILVQTEQGAWAQLLTEADSNGAEMPVVTTDAPDTAFLLEQPNGQWVKLAAKTTESGPLLLCVQPG